MRPNELHGRVPTIPPANPRAPLLLTLWGCVGVILFLATSVYRLAMRATHLDVAELTAMQAGFGVVWMVFMVYTEAYRGFYGQFSPRVVQRALYLPTQPLVVLFAPIAAMGLFHATRKRKIVGWSLITGIVCLVLVVRQLPAPWRELIDVGVTAGLGLGTLTVVWFTVRAMWGREPGVDPEFPASEVPAVG